MKIDIKKLPKSLVEITGEIPKEKFEEKRKDALKNLAGKVEIDGFRKGMVPESVLIKKLGAMSILEEMAHLSLNEAYPEIVIKHELDVIGYPEISITKIAEGNPLGFKIVSALVPEIELPNYKKIASEIVSKKEEVSITDGEVEKTIEEIRKQRAVKKDLGDGKTEEILPELNDEFAKSLGDFDSVSQLKNKMKENMKLEKEFRNKEKNRIAIMEGVISGMKGEIPDILVEGETEKLIGRMKMDIEKMGLKFEDYLKNLKKTEDEIRKEWQGEGEKRAKIELALVKIAKIENIKPDEVEIEKEIKHILEHYKEAKEERVRDYVINLLTNEKVFEFLENQK